MDGAGGDVAVVALLLGGANDELAVGPRDQVDVAALDDRADGVADDVRQITRVPQPQDLALDRADGLADLVGHALDAAGGPAGGDDDVGGGQLSRLSRRTVVGRGAEPDQTGGDVGDVADDRADAGPAGRHAEGGQVAAVVDRQVAGGEDAAPGGRGQKRLQPTARPGVEALGLEPDRVAELGQPVERGQVAAVVGDREGSLGPEPGRLPGRRLELGVEGGEAVDRVQVQGQQVLLAEDGLGDRAEHARRDQARLVIGVRIDEGDLVPGDGGAPGDRGADHAATDDDDVSVHHGLPALSLRRHYPDQVRRSEAVRLPLSPAQGSRGSPHCNPALAAGPRRLLGGRPGAA